MKELRMKRVLQDERGMALALAIVALVIVGALVAGALFSGTQEQRMAENARFQQQSFGVAELGAYTALSGWPQNRNTYNGKRAYPLDSATGMNAGAWSPAPNKTGSYSGSVYKLNSNMYLVDVTGRDSMSRANRLRGGGFSQRIGILTRIVPLNVDVQAAMTLGGPVTWGGGNTFVNGADNAPPAGNNWGGCGPAGASLAGVRAKTIGDLGASNGQFKGTPDSIISPTMDTSTFYNYGYTNYGTLTSQANITLTPGNYTPSPVVLNGACNTTGQLTNWGDGNDHNAPCGTYFPIVWLKGASTATWFLIGGQGQGVLLVDGNVSMDGNFEFYGLVVVRGTLTTVANSTVKIYGGVLAKNANFAPNGSGSGSFTVNWSSCAMTQALSGTGVGALNRSRSWIQLY
jgi:hypothetical protein